MTTTLANNKVEVLLTKEEIVMLKNDISTSMNIIKENERILNQLNGEVNNK